MTKKIIGYNNYGVLIKNFTNDFFITFWVKNAFFSTLKFLNDEISNFFVCHFEWASPPPPPPTHPIHYSQLLTNFRESEEKKFSRLRNKQPPKEFSEERCS